MLLGSQCCKQILRDQTQLHSHVSLLLRYDAQVNEWELFCRPGCPLYYNWRAPISLQIEGLVSVQLSISVPPSVQSKHSALVLRLLVLLGDWLQPGPLWTALHGNPCSSLILLAHPAHSTYHLLLTSLILLPSSPWCSQPPWSHWTVAALTSPIFSRSIHSCFCYPGLPRFAVKLWELCWCCLGTAAIPSDHLY